MGWCCVPCWTRTRGTHSALNRLGANQTGFIQFMARDMVCIRRSADSSIMMSWGSDKNMYQILKENNCTIPTEGLNMIRFHFFSLGTPSVLTLTWRLQKTQLCSMNNFTQQLAVS